MSIDIFSSLCDDQTDSDKYLRDYFNTIWQLDNIILLIGAGFSKDLNGPLMEDLSINILPNIIKEGLNINDSNVKIAWKNLWSFDEQIYEKLMKDLIDDEVINIIKSINIEDSITNLQILNKGLELLQLDVTFLQAAEREIKTKIIEKVKSVVPDPITHGSEYSTYIISLQKYSDFFRKIIKSRRPSQPRLKIFTTNYDKVIESICDVNGITCNSGFDGEYIRTFNSNNFELNMALKPNGQNTLFYQNYLYLYKLHGSIDWQNIEIDGLNTLTQQRQASESSVIYPCSSKYANSLENPFGDLFRKLGESVSLPQSVIITLGYGFGDTHINDIIGRSLKNPSVQLIIINPKIRKGNDASAIESRTNNPYLATLINQTGYPLNNKSGDPRICIIGGSDALIPKIFDRIAPSDDSIDDLSKLKELMKEFAKLGGANG